EGWQDAALADGVGEAGQIGIVLANLAVPWARVEPVDRDHGQFGGVDEGGQGGGRGGEDGGTGRGFRHRGIGGGGGRGASGGRLLELGHDASPGGSAGL